jgi:decaprenylphospho-beta-D-ribofuranose 2-oxidase
VSSRAHYEYVEGWGMAVGHHARVLRPRSAEELAQVFDDARRAGAKLCLRGGGNSYGDANTSDRGHVLDLSGLDRLLAFDEDSGRVEAQGGVTIERLWKHILPLGYWPKVVSGTMFPTLAGAAAANIHGKNNFAVGTIGDAIVEFDLLTPAGELLTCSRTANADLFHAAIGGFGMLGAIVRVVMDTKRVHSGDLWVRGISARNLREMMGHIEAHKGSADYLVGWIDAFADEQESGRGLIHAAHYLAEGEDPAPERTLTVAHQELPANILGVFPKSEVWRLLALFNHDPGMRLVNAVKYQSGRLESFKGRFRQSHAGFAFLLDYVPNWKFAYGRARGERGLIQYQPFLPAAVAHDVLQDLLARARHARLVPYLGVLKRHRPDPFWLTHAVDGWSLAMDFKVQPATRERLWALCAQMTRVVLDAGGRFYFAKDAVLSAADAQRFLPADKLAAFRALKRRHDPEGLLASDLSRRVLGW